MKCTRRGCYALPASRSAGRASRHPKRRTKALRAIIPPNHFRGSRFPPRGAMLIYSLPRVNARRSLNEVFMRTLQLLTLALLATAAKADYQMVLCGGSYGECQVTAVTRTPDDAQRAVLDAYIS